MKLYLLDDYNSADSHWKKGDEIEVDDNLGNWFLADAPGVFSLEAPEKPKAKGKPRRAANKAVKEPVEEKDAE